LRFCDGVEHVGGRCRPRHYEIIFQCRNISTFHWFHELIRTDPDEGLDAPPSLVITYR
jgi:hypothetical protein